MTRVVILLLSTPLLLAAGPQAPYTGYNYKLGTTLTTPQPGTDTTGGPAFEPAPLPNRDLTPPQSTASNDPQFGPSLFTPNTQFRGDGFSPGSTAQGAQERNVHPTPGFSLTVPVQ
jgi:hypothetical protein